MKKVLSISIAAYNIEKFIRHTLDSFIIEEIINDIEVIIVNDGSKDKTSQIAHEYQEKYKGLFRVIDKENGGYGSTINEAVKIAEGKYFKTIDGDDWVDESGFVKLVKYLDHCDDDMVISGFARVSDKNGKIIPTYYVNADYEVTHSFEEANMKQDIYMQGISFKTSILKEIDLEITKHCFYTDIEYILTPIPYINTVSFIDANVYMYRVAVNEQSMSIAGKKKHIDEQLKIYQKMIRYFEKYSETLSEEKKKYFEIILAGMLKSHTAAILSLDVNTNSLKRLKEIEDFTKKNAEKVYKESNKYKVIKILRKSNYHLYALGSIAFKLYHKVLPS